MSETGPDYSSALERFSQDFETNTSGYASNGGSIAIEASGSNGVTSADGVSHARIAESEAGGVFTRLGGYRRDDDQGFVTSVQVYLDTDMLAGEGFDYSVAANGPDGAHQRDFIFHVAKDSSTLQLLIGADNNTNNEPREDLDAGNHAVISSSGWYTFEHRFYENGAGDLEVAMHVYDSLGSLLFTEVRSAAADDFDTEYGGNRYGWFTNIDVTGGIAIDNASMATLDTNPVQVFAGTNILGTFATVEAAQAAIEAGAISGAVLFIETTGLDDGFFFVADPAAAAAMSIQAAINAAADGDSIVIGAGLFDEDLTISKALSITGVQAGVSGADGGRNAATGAGESTILGDAKITSTGDVTIDGVRFLNDATTTGNGAGNAALLVAASGGVKTITNSVFWSSVVGGAVEDRAFATQVLANTDINFTDNLISGSAASGFSGASWQRGVWFDGGEGVDLVMTGNVITYARTGVNADMTGSSTVTASGNTFNTNGTAFSVGVDMGGFDPSNNSFNQVGTEYNFRNITSDINFDLDGDIASITGTGGNELANVLGGNGADTLTGSANADWLDGNNLSAAADADVLDGKGGNDILQGKGGDDSLTGGAGLDTLVGGTGTDTAYYTDVLTAASFSTITDADPLTAGNQAGWSIAGDDGDTATGVERVVDGDGNVFLLVGSGGYATIQEAVAAAADGATILVADGIYELGAATLTIDKEITLVGQSEAGVIINGAGIDGYGILVAADNVSLSNFTLHGPQAGGASGNYGIKVGPVTGVATDRLLNFTLENATIDSSGRSEVDLNGVVGATITNVTADGNGTGGVGFAITDSADVTLTDIETIDNAWGSVALYNSNVFYDQQIENITFAGSYVANESIGIYSEKSAPGAQDIGSVTFPPSFTGDGDGVWTVTNDTYRGSGSPNFTFYFADEADAQAFALSLQAAPNTANNRSVVSDPDGNQHVFDGMSLQAAIDASDEGDSIFVHPGDYTEAANYNPSNNTNSGSNPLGLLVNKSVSIVGVDAAGDVITGTGDIVAKVTAAVQSNWGTNFFVTADDVTISGLRFEATGPGFVNKAFEVIQGGFVLEDSIVTSVTNVPIYSAVYINDESTPGDLTGFVSDIGSYRLDGNIFDSSVVVTNGAGLGVVGFSGVVTNNLFQNTAWVDPQVNDDANWPLLLTGKVDGVAWQNAAVATPTDVSGNTFELGNDAQILLRLRDQNPSDIADLAFVEAYLANNDTGPSAYVLTPAGELRLVQAAPGAAHTFYVVPSVGGVMDLTNAFPFGDPIPLAEAGDTVVVDTDGETEAATVTIDDLTFLVSAGSDDLNLTLGGSVVEVTLADYALDMGADVDVAGNGEDNVITGNSGDNKLSGGTGNDDITGGAGNDNIAGNSGVDILNGGDGDDTIDGGGGRDTVYFSAGTDFAHGGAGNDTLILPGTAADYSIVIVGAGHYEITRTADSAFTEAVSFENVSFISAVTLDAKNDSLTVDAGAVRALDVRANDTGSGLVIAASVTSGSGTATPGAGGTLVNLDLTTAYKSLDVGQTATVTVLYLLSDGSSSDVAQVTVTVNGAADAIGAVSDANVAANAVDEELAAGAVVGVTALATDPDATATVSYSLTDNADGAFQINASTGVVTTARAIDREGPDGASQTITVLATSSDGTSTSKDFTIVINDVNDAVISTPVDADAATNAVDENAVAGTLVGITASASDPDVGDETVVYTLDNDAGGRFQIDSGTGVVSLAGPIDRETDSSFSIIVRATSPDTSFSTETFTIDVNDVDEFDVTAPVDVDGVSGGSVTENAAIGSSVGIIASASDADATANGVTYSLLDNDGGRFLISVTTGEVLVASAIDREGGAIRSITVRATSADGSTADTGFSIAVADVDEFDVTAPVDADAAANLVDSTPTLGEYTGLTASATDADSTNSGVTYSLVVGDDDFDIDANTGAVSVGATFNTSGPSTRLITVQAASADGSTASSIFSINYVGGETTLTGTAGNDTLNGTNTRNIINALAGNDRVNGLGGDDTIDGGDGNDIIDGGLGDDEMIGGAGNDTYYVDSLGDTVTEASGSIGGTRDIVYADLSIAALFANVEELVLAGATGNENLNGAGNAIDNRITGNNGNNILDGGDGKDTLIGMGGNDTLIGGAGVDQLIGGDGDDTLNGGAERDALTGGAGADDFVLDFIPSDPTKADRVLDYSSIDGDQIVLSAAIFGSLAGGVAAGNIVVGSAALDADDYLIYNVNGSRLLYDADGNGSGAAQLIAKLDGVTTLSESDFEILI